MTRQQIARLKNGRLHLNDGPIDLVIGCDGAREAVERTEAAAIARFETVLDELCAELPLLRAATGPQPKGAVARRMWAATAPFASEVFITPMAAVAGAVAEEILTAMTESAPLARAFVNNGGDIAFHLEAGQSYRLGLMDRPDRPMLFATAEIAAENAVRGVATSGWRGRSFSFGIADAVTVLAERASLADAAATLIANAVNVPRSSKIDRRPARYLAPDTDLGERLVTVGVGCLSTSEIEQALDQGAAQAKTFLSRGLLGACALHLCGVTRTVGADLVSRPELPVHA
jgi:ApbE superfamily uncharacterized protein (UPF0280 family)